MFHIKFTYLKTVDVTQYFCFSKVIQNVQKAHYKCKLHLPKQSNCNTLLSHKADVIHITCLLHMLTVTTLGVPSPQ